MIVVYSSRMRLPCWTLLCNVGLDDLGADTEEEFAQKAFDLANDVERLRDLKKNLRGSLSDMPLFDSEPFRKGFENVVRLAYLRYCFENKAPADFSSYTGDLNSLYRDCLRASDILEYMASEEEVTFERLKMLSDEYFSMVKLLLIELIEDYKEQPGALTLIQRITDALVLLNNVVDKKNITSLINVVNSSLLKLTRGENA